MPKRPVKNPRKPGFQPGESGNKAGRPLGTPNKVVISEKVKEAFEQLLQGAVPHLEDWLIRTAQKHPDKALDLWVKISERFVPSLARTEITGTDGAPLIPITINIPTIQLPGNVPKTIENPANIPLDLPGREGASGILPDSPQMLPLSSEGASTDLPPESEKSTPGEDISADIPKFVYAPELPVKAPTGYKREF